MKIVNGKRPIIVPETPLEYRKLMEQCWDADPSERPNIATILLEIRKLTKLYFQNEPIFFNQELSTTCINNSIDSIRNNCTSKIYQFKNLPEPRNATEGMMIYLIFVKALMVNIIVLIHIIYKLNKNRRSRRYAILLI